MDALKNVFFKCRFRTLLLVIKIILVGYVDKYWVCVERFILTDSYCWFVATLFKGCGISFIHKRHLIGCTRVKASKWHIASSRTDMGLWFISSCCIREQAFNHSLDRWVSHMPGYTGTVYGWNMSEKIADKSLHWLVLST